MMPLLQLLLAMLLIIMSWAFLMLVFCGQGLALRRLFGLRGIGANEVLMSFWVGLALTIGLLQLWHLFFAINLWALVVVIALGTVGLLWRGRVMAAWLIPALRRNKAMIIALCVVAIWLANRSAGPCTTYDSGLYHCSAVRWTTLHPIVPGLANLHGRLGFNNANFLLAGMVEASPWYGRSNHVVNGLIILALMFQCVLGAFRLGGKNHEERSIGLFNLVLFSPAALIASHSWISSHSTDLPMLAVIYISASHLFAYLVRRRDDLREDNFAIFFILLMLTLAVCLKLSAAPLALLAGILLLIVWTVRTHRLRVMSGTLAWIVLCCGILLGTWVVRGIILSGYPAFPSLIGPVDVPWRLPSELALEHHLAIATSARWTFGTPLQDAGGWAWVGPWMEHLGREVVLPCVLVVLAGAGALYLYRRCKNRPRCGRNTAWLSAIPPFLAVLIWFLTAPAPRFGSGFFWILAASIIAAVFYRFAANAPQAVIRLILIAGLVLGICNIKKFFKAGGTDHGFHPTPRAKLETFTTASGLKIYIPVGDDRCWDAPQPCSPYSRTHLRLRRIGDLSAGFIIDGDFGPGPMLRNKKNPQTPPPAKAP